LRYIVLIDDNKILFTAEILIFIYQLNPHIVEKSMLPKKKKKIKRNQSGPVRVRVRTKVLRIPMHVVRGD
jgi:Tfp pilus assembly PilM family ATPase